MDIRQRSFLTLLMRLPRSGRSVRIWFFLDIILPGANGQYILRQIREKSDVPVIMLTSKDGEVEEIMSRSSGADDYVTKPYNPTILLLRIETILRRTEQTGRQSEQRASSVRGEKAEGEAVQGRTAG